MAHSEAFSATTVMINLGDGHKLLAASVYRRDRNNNQESIQDMEEWLRNALSQNTEANILIGGDLNVRHQMFGCCGTHDANKAGKVLAGLLSSDPSVTLLNDGSATRNAHAGSSRLDQPSALDVTVVKQQSALFLGWRTGAQWRSDHHAIHF
jgi:hypothetical protein